MILKKFKWFMLIPLAIVLLALIIGIFSGGLNIGIDFTGGSLVTVYVNEDYDEEVIRQAALDVEGIQGEVSVVKAGDDMTQAVIRLQSSGDEANDAALVDSMVANIQKSYPNATYQGVESVGGTASGDLVASAIKAVLIASVLMLIYIWIRFDLYSGIGALVALIHDVIIMLCAMCIFRIQVDSTFIAAALTIVGYSINDTVIIFDRVRDNLRIMDPKEYSKGQVLDRSIKESMSRTINTSITTLIMIVVLYILGVQSIKVFALPIIVGVVMGTFSSNIIAGSVWMMLLEKFGTRTGKRRRVKTIR
ncbi:MAG: protein translocase subunit SecF [Christensenellaceae bacterium]|nr:protein translocase subunit SecF [Christensenellaceae bacterium]